MASGLTVVGLMVKLLQVAAAWLTGKLFPAIVALSERGPPVFWVQETVVDPDPLPLVGETDIQDPLPEAVQLPPVHPEG